MNYWLPEWIQLDGYRWLRNMDKTRTGHNIRTFSWQVVISVFNELPAGLHFDSLTDWFVSFWFSNWVSAKGKHNNKNCTTYGERAKLHHFPMVQKGWLGLEIYDSLFLLMRFWPKSLIWGVCFYFIFKWKWMWIWQWKDTPLNTKYFEQGWILDDDFGHSWRYMTFWYYNRCVNFRNMYYDCLRLCGESILGKTLLK